MRALDEEFKEPQVDHTDDVVSKFCGLWREHSQTMENYIMTMKQAKAEMKRFDPDTQISDKACAVHIFEEGGADEG